MKAHLDETHNAQPAAARAAGWAALVALGFWLTLFVYAVHGAMPFNPVRLPFEKQIRTLAWIPEGWAFFTRDPREERLLTMRREEDGHWDLGLARSQRALPVCLRPEPRPRAQGVETGLLVGEIPGSAWASCKETPVRCLDGASAPRTVRNPSPDPQLCGSLGFVMQKPVPWAWSRSAEKITMPSRVARLEVTCE